MKQLWAKIKNILDIPFDPREEDSYQENLIGSLINLGIVIIIAWGIFGVTTRGLLSHQMIMVFILLILMFIARFFVQRGKARLVSLLLVHY